MNITFISFERALITGLALMLAFALYAWKVRPILRQRPEFDWFYVRVDSYWRSLGAWLKVRWDIAAAAFLAALPILWNGALDAIVALSLFLGEALPAVAGIDLSGVVMPAWLKTTIQVGGALVPAFRAAFIKKKDDV